MKKKTSTIAARAGIGEDEACGAVVPPLYLSTNFTFERFGVKRRYDYTRSGNPTRDLLGDAIAELEGGAGGVVTASGMAALTLLTQQLDAGARVIAPHDCYGGTFRLLNALRANGRLKVDFVNQRDPDVVASALRDPVALVLVETPSNPLLRVVDIAGIVRAAKPRGALVAVDNTFLSPALQQPIALGADIVVHSTTKYLNGHSDVVGGAVVGATPEITEKLAWWANCLGLTGAPFDAWLTLRGLRTLDARMRVHQENATSVVDLLTRHPAVERVYYPGLENHPGHEIARKQQRGFGAMVSFEVRGGEAGVRAFLDGLELFALAESLGGVESLVAHPATMTHAAMSPEARATAGISASLVRLSVGIEAAEDLVADLHAGLDRAAAIPPRRALSRSTTGSSRPSSLLPA